MTWCFQSETRRCFAGGNWNGEKRPPAGCTKKQDLSMLIFSFDSFCRPVSKPVVSPSEQTPPTVAWLCVPDLQLPNLVCNSSCFWLSTAASQNSTQNSTQRSPTTSLTETKTATKDANVAPTTSLAASEQLPKMQTWHQAPPLWEVRTRNSYRYLGKNELIVSISMLTDRVCRWFNGRLRYNVLRLCKVQ